MNDITLPLTQNQVTVISPEDSDLSFYKWFAHYAPAINLFYAQRSIHPGTMFLHRVILSRILNRPIVKGELCDHENGDTLDNRRSNLRLADKYQNARNARKRADNTSGYKGVTWNKRDKHWRAQIRVNNKTIQLGLYDTPELAYEVYCKAALKYHGEFARLK